MRRTETGIAPEVLAEGCEDILVRFEADTVHHQHAVTEQALDALLVQLLEEVAAVCGHRVHVQAFRRPAQRMQIKHESRRQDWELNGTKSTD